LAFVVASKGTREGDGECKGEKQREREKKRKKTGEGERHANFLGEEKLDYEI